MSHPFPSALLFLLLLAPLALASFHTHLHPVLQCLHHQHTLPSDLLLSPNSSSYSTLQTAVVRNLRVVTHNATQPLLIVTPTSDPHVQATVLCARAHNLHVRVRSGGHDYEGLSYQSDGTPFILIDLRNLSSVSVDAHRRTAWVQAGATLGQLYYGIAEKSKTLAFPGGLCPSVGVGGHISGGGIGTMMRAHGLAADNIIDARLVTADGKILDRRSMGDDLFWAIRGGGAASFAVVLAYKLRLVEVPSRITVFNKTLGAGEGTSRALGEWQKMAYKVDKRLFVRATIRGLGGDGAKNKSVMATFDSLFLGGKEEMLDLLGESFPALGLDPQDLIEMSWIESVLFFVGIKNGTSVLQDRMYQPNIAYKAKSDFVSDPISETAWERIWSWIWESDVERFYMIVDPFGGRMDEIPETHTPFPNREGMLYNIQYFLWWRNASDDGAARKHVDWLRQFYMRMAPYVSKNPRRTYLNYRDLDLGRNRDGMVSYSEAKVWGTRYFMGNFKRLAYVKSAVDPTNYFRHEQSIPPLDIQLE